MMTGYQTAYITMTLIIAPAHPSYRQVLFNL